MHMLSGLTKCACGSTVSHSRSALTLPSSFEMHAVSMCAAAPYASYPHVYTAQQLVQLVQCMA